MAAPISDGEDKDDSASLVFQRGKKLGDEYYIISVYDNVDATTVKFSAFELESSETFDLCFSHSDFDALFKTNAELAAGTNKERRYDWVIDRLDAVPGDSGGVFKRLVLLDEPTREDDGRVPASRSGVGQVAVQKDRLTYAERMRLKVEAEKLEEKREKNIALKSERNRRAFMAELREKRKLEELKLASRKQRIDEERAERREKAAAEKRILEEKTRRYTENDQKREERIRILEAERRARDLARIQDIIQTASAKKEAKKQMLEEARERKTTEEAQLQADFAAKQEVQRILDERREQQIGQREERLRHRELEYLANRELQIQNLAKEANEKDERKKAWLQDRAAHRAMQLRLKHEKIEAWERLDDQRTQNNVRREHARNMLMLDHVEALREKYSQDMQDANERKRQALDVRKDREAREAAKTADELAKNQELEESRDRHIVARESAREERNQRYCRHIRDKKTAEALAVRAQTEQVEKARERQRQERARERQSRSHADVVAAQTASMREDNIKKRERERDLKFAAQVREWKEREREAAVLLTSKKHQKRLHEKEDAERHREEESQRRRQMALLDEQRDDNIRQRSAERNNREQDRLRNAGRSGVPPSRCRCPSPQAQATTEAQAATEAAWNLAEEALRPQR